VDVDDDRGAGAEARDLLDEDGEGGVIHAPAAVLLGDGDAQQAQRGGARNRLLREAMFGVGLMRPRGDLASGEVARQRPQLIVGRGLEF
jgi:hypothetical protein